MKTACIDIGVKHIADGGIDEIIYGLISLLHSFDPEAVVLGGVMKQQYIPQRLSVQLYPLLKPSFRTCRLLPAQLGTRADLMGAGHLVCQQVESEFSIIEAFGKASP